MEFEVRTAIGTLEFFKSFAKAFEYIQANLSSVDKISWSEPDEKKDRYRNRWLPKRKCDQWSIASEGKMCQLSEEYDQEPEDSTKLFWICQLAMPPNPSALLLHAGWTEKQQEMVWRLECLVDIMSNSKFYEKFKDI